MSLQALADQHFVRRRLTAAAAARAAKSLWGQVDPVRLDATYPLGTAVRALAAAQLVAARQSEEYVEAAVAAQDLDAPPAARVNAHGLAGTAADGRSLTTLLAEPVIAAKVAAGQGRSLADVSGSGLVSLLRIFTSETYDAGRVADGVGIAARPKLQGYVRMLRPPSCSRCAILAGKFYRWNAGFQRHRACDCVHIPVQEAVAGDLTTDPLAAIRSGQVTGLSKADTQAILRDGADPYQVINSRRGMYSAGGRKFTREGTTKRGLAGQINPGVARPRPEQIYRDATSREQAIELLRRFGYVT